MSVLPSSTQRFGKYFINFCNPRINVSDKNNLVRYV